MRMSLVKQIYSAKYDAKLSGLSVVLLMLHIFKTSLSVIESLRVLDICFVQMVWRDVLKGE